jgi:general secretion pathway protein K
MLKLNNNSGVALIITLSIIAVLVMTTLELNRKARSLVYMARIFRERVQLHQMAMSGVHAAMALLIADKENSDIDSIQEDWANAETIETLLLELPFDQGNVRVSIEDELGKIQVNALVKYPEGTVFNVAQRRMWEHFLDLAIPNLDRTDDTAPGPIINALKDWLDFGDDDLITGLSGAESEYYLDLDPAYACPNAPLNHLSELLLVKGVSADLFDGVGGIPGIASYMTVWGASESGDNQYTFNGAININTADLPVIAAILPAENEHLAQSIFAYREEMSNGSYAHDLNGATWYRDAPGCSDLEIDPALIQTKSDLFRIYTEAVYRDITLNAQAVVSRVKDKKSGKWHAKILSWQEK